MKEYSWLENHPESTMHEVTRRIQMVAPSALPVLILGETGVGKEVVARSIHEASPRSTGPFIAVNCGALSPSLLEGMLFGSVRGAYTGSYAENKGFIRAAHQGTLFLDEIGELPLDAQSRLLRVLQERKVNPLGSHQEVAVDFRLVCATHRNLQDAVALKLFREDLFFRIHAFPIRITPLRERPADIIPLASNLWATLSQDKPPLEQCTSYEDRAAMIRFPWPGNVRQLRNVIEKYSLLFEFGATFKSLLQEEPLGFAAHETSPHYKTIRERKFIEPQRIMQILTEQHANRSSTARALGISRGALNYQIRKHGLATE